MVAAAGGVAGDAVGKRKMRRSERAARRKLGTARHALVDGKTDLALDMRRNGIGQHLSDITGVMGPMKPRRRDRFSQAEPAGKAERFEPFHEMAVFAHRKAMVRREAGVVVGMADDLKRHGQLLNHRGEFDWPHNLNGCGRWGNRGMCPSGRFGNREDYRWNTHRQRAV